MSLTNPAVVDGGTTFVAVSIPRSNQDNNGVTHRLLETNGNETKLSLVRRVVKNSKTPAGSERHSVKLTFMDYQDSDHPLGIEYSALISIDAPIGQSPETAAHLALALCDYTVDNAVAITAGEV